MIDLHRRWKNLLLASAALTVTAAAVAGCASNYNPHGKDSGATYYSNKTNSTVATTATTTIAEPGTTVVTTNSVAPSNTVVYPSNTTTQYVLVPATNANTVGGTVLVPASPVPASQVMSSDVDFMARASQFNATEIAMSQIAYQRAQSSAVRNFAQATIAEHQRLANELNGVAQRRNVSLAFQPNPAGSAAVNRMANLSGWDLDRAYLDQIIADHQAASAMYGSESNQAVDITLRSTAGGDAVDLRNRTDQAVRLRTDID
jgi:putative membrane protein